MSDHNVDGMELSEVMPRPVLDDPPGKLVD